MAEQKEWKTAVTTDERTVECSVEMKAEWMAGQWVGTLGRKTVE